MSDFSCKVTSGLEPLVTAIKSQGRAMVTTIAIALGITSAYVVYDRAAAWEAYYYPIFGKAYGCTKGMPLPIGTTRKEAREVCGEDFEVYQPYTQDTAICIGNDAYVWGYMTKVRKNSKFVKTSQKFYFGTPHGRFKPVDFNNDPDDPNSDYIRVNNASNFNPNRPVGIQDWGPYRLRNGCMPNRKYDKWYLTTEHESFHPFYTIEFVSKAMNLPSLSSHSQ